MGGIDNDFLTDVAGSNAINGGAGFDTLKVEGTRSARIVEADYGRIIVSGSDGTNVIDGVERILFTDGTIAFDTIGNAGQMYRLYQAAFARKPDEAGLGGWIKQLDAGHGDLVWAAQHFIASDEFRARYGSPETVSDEAFLNLLYNNVLGRDADAGGLAYWMGQMAYGLGRDRVLASFSEGEENQELVAAETQYGIWYI